MKQQFYFWHKWIGIAACAAVFAWSLTGFLHPLMSWTQPRSAQPFLKSQLLVPENFKTELDAALRKNNLQTFGGFNTVRFDGATYYQILPDKNGNAGSAETGESCHSSIVSDSIVAKPPLYLNAETGAELSNGDEKYAEFLARYFAGEQRASVKSITLVTDFDSEYKPNNRLLPVYAIEFDRPDALKVYVDTTSSKLATLVDTRKFWLQWFFVNFHNLEFAGMPELTRKIVVTAAMLLVALTAVSGLIVYTMFWRSYCKAKAVTNRSLVRKYHRVGGALVSVFLLAWSASGLFHLWAKANRRDTAKTQIAASFTTERFDFSLTEILKNEPQTTAVSLIGLDARMFYRIARSNHTIGYFDVQTGAELPNGEARYASYLAAQFSGLSEPISIQPLTKFTGEYGFLQKRLPVVKVQFAENSNERVYVDTASATLAMRARDGIAQIEDVSFDYLHKGHWLDWAGKYVRDAVLMMIALGNSLVALLGIRLFVGFKRKKQSGAVEIHNLET
jgi:uncharacterized iron-regulated membrane protein